MVRESPARRAKVIAYRRGEMVGLLCALQFGQQVLFGMAFVLIVALERTKGEEAILSYRRDGCMSTMDPFELR